MSNEEKKTEEMQNENTLTRGSIICTYNKHNNSNNWFVVLGCMEDHESVTCVRLTDDKAFKEIPELAINTDVFGQDVSVYANPFGIVNVNISYITEVKKTISNIEFFNVVTSITHYFLGFLYKDKEDNYRIDTPHLRNPLLPIMMGMVSIDDARNMELQARINLAMRKEKKEKEKAQRKINQVREIKSRHVKKDIVGELENLGVYTMDTMDRIEAIYKVFSRYLANGKLSINIAYNAMFMNKPLAKMRVNSAVTKEEFAAIINSDVANVAKILGKGSQYASQIRRKAICIFNGTDKVGKNVFSDTDIATIKIIIRDTESKEDALELIQKQFKVDVASATYIYNRLNKAHKGASTKYSREVKELDDRLLAMLDQKWIKGLNCYDAVSEYLTSHIDKISEIYNGSYEVNTGDPAADIAILVCFGRCVHSWYWYKFIEYPMYKRLAKYLNEASVKDLVMLFKDKSVSQAGFITCALIQLKIYAGFLMMSNTEKELFIDRYTNPDKGILIDQFDQLFCLASRGTYMIFTKSILKSISKLFGTTSIDGVVSKAGNFKVSFADLDKDGTLQKRFNR